MTNLDRSVVEFLRNVVEGLEATGSALQHVYFSNGTKYYGVHLGACNTPFREDDPRCVTRQQQYAARPHWHACL